MNITAAADLLATCRHLLDANAQPVTVHTGHNGSPVLRAMTTAGEVIVKCHRGPDRHQQELHAYQHWTPALHRRTPHLLAASDTPPVIVITALPGQPLAETHLDPEQEASAHRQAGELLNRLHHAAEPRTEPNTATWLAERGDQWLHLAKNILPAHRRTEIRAHLQALTQLGTIPAVPCHLDYTPRNLIINPQGDIAVIDFEHARYDLAARDLVRLATRIWTTRPDLEHAFQQGYGQLTDLDRHIIEHCTHLDALTAAVRASTGAAPAVADGSRGLGKSTCRRSSRADGHA